MGNSLLTIQSDGNTKIESVTFAGEAISTVSTLEMDGTLSLSGTASQAITHTGTAANTNDFLTVSSTNGNVKIEAVTFAGQAISTVTTLDMGGTLTLKNSGAQTIDHNHNSLLTIQSDGNTKIESVTFAGQAISTVTTLDMSGALTGLTTLT